MRYQGQITDWRDDRGFGFITPNDGGATVFVHISAFERGQGRPRQGALVTYELVKDGKKGDRAGRVRYFGERLGSRSSAPRRVSLITAALVLGIGAMVYGWAQLRPVLFEQVANSDHAPSGWALQSGSSMSFECRGKRYCSEMSSCEEATFYLRNCPGVEIDGDGDGVPCESQWCGH